MGEESSPPGATDEAPPAARRRGLARVWAALQGARHVILTTHVNADGDGAGSEAAVAHVLRRLGAAPTVVNPTPFPDTFRFLLGDMEAYTPADPAGRAALEKADLILVLDTSELSRIGALAPALEGTAVAVLDHHPPEGAPLGEPSVRDPTACATGELVHDLLWVGRVEMTVAEARGIYVAIATDTGSFRFSNTTARAHTLAARCIRVGVDPADMYRRLYAQYSPERLELLRRALGSLRVEAETGLTWISVSREDIEASGAGSEDTDGVVEFARRLQGTEVAIFFRELHDGRTKVSLRSNGDADVAAVAHSLGGGGHQKAAGLLLDTPLAEARREVLDRMRTALRRQDRKA